jgi:multidrug transporter EmrE-like cation transporter
MSEWWTYRLYDFLLFTPRTYYRLFELYNAAVWPGQILALLAGLYLVCLCARAPLTPALSPRGVRGGGERLAFCILAVSWTWAGVAFLALRYATINFAAKYAAWSFVGEAALLLWIAVRGRFEPRPGLARGVGIGLVLFAVLVEPLSAPLLGRPLRQIELFGLAPDPTAVAALGALLALRPRRRWALMIVPVLWCVLTGLTLLAMSARDWWIAPAVAVIAAALAARTRYRAPSAA